MLATPAAADPVTVLAFGDSLTQGYGLAQDEGFVPQLQKWLQDKGLDVVLVNGGVSGDTTAGGAGRIGWSLSEDIDAVIVALGGNDLLRGIEPAQTRANLDKILAEITGRDLPVLLVGQAATGNFGQAYKTEFDAIFPSLAEAYDVPLYPLFLGPLEAIGDRQTVLATYLQQDATHPNGAGVALIVGAMGPAVESLVESAKTR